MKYEFILRTESLSVSFGGLTALNRVDFEMREGEIQAVIGPNGAGKTTLFNVLSGNLRPTKGRVVFKGEDITGLPPYEVCRRGLSKTFQKTSIFPDLTVFENVRLGAHTGHGSVNPILRSANSDRAVVEKVEELLLMGGLQDQKNQPAGNLSHGDQRLLEILIGISTQPELLLLDEPSAGLSAKETRYITRWIKELSQTTIRNIVIVEHDMDVVTELADSVCVLNYGEVLCRGTVGEVKCNPQVQDVYLGRPV
ncbi:MAG: ABC transporter ATP-binding protein [Thermodesulfobacteriota bacterium]